MIKAIGKEDLAAVIHADSLFRRVEYDANAAALCVLQQAWAVGVNFVFQLVSAQFEKRFAQRDKLLYLLGKVAESAAVRRVTAREMARPAFSPIVA